MHTFPGFSDFYANYARSYFYLLYRLYRCKIVNGLPYFSGSGGDFATLIVGGCRKEDDMQLQMLWRPPPSIRMATTMMMTGCRKDGDMCNLKCVKIHRRHRCGIYVCVSLQIPCIYAPGDSNPQYLSILEKLSLQWTCSGSQVPAVIHLCGMYVSIIGYNSSFPYFSYLEYHEYTYKYTVWDLICWILISYNPITHQ